MFESLFMGNKPSVHSCYGVLVTPRSRHLHVRRSPCLKGPSSSVALWSSFFFLVLCAFRKQHHPIWVTISGVEGPIQYYVLSLPFVDTFLCAMGGAVPGRSKPTCRQAPRPEVQCVSGYALALKRAHERLSLRGCGVPVDRSAPAGKNAQAKRKLKMRPISTATRTSLRSRSCCFSSPKYLARYGVPMFW